MISGFGGFGALGWRTEGVQGLSLWIYMGAHGVLGVGLLCLSSLNSDRKYASSHPT